MFVPNFFVSCNLEVAEGLDVLYTAEILCKKSHVGPPKLQPCSSSVTTTSGHSSPLPAVFISFHSPDSLWKT